MFIFFAPSTIQEALHHYGKVFSDCCCYDFLRRAGRCELFVAGVPCQPFSSIGVHQGLQDPRGNVVVWLLKYIWTWKPQMFVLENVKGLATQHSGTLSLILETLGMMTTAAGVALYKTSWKVLNTRDVGGLPQNRERLFPS